MQHPESTYRLRQNLPKTERLCSEKIIARLFQSGVFVSKYPLRLNAIVDAISQQANAMGNARVQVLFSVSKRRFPRAVDRNRMKRLMREVYRKDKGELWDYALGEQVVLSIAMIYTGNTLLDYAPLESLWKEVKGRLIKKLNATAERSMA